MPKPTKRWQVSLDDGGDFITYGERGSDDDESFTVYLPAEEKERFRAKGVIVRALNRAKITVPPQAKRPEAEHDTPETVAEKSKAARAVGKQLGEALR